MQQLDRADEQPNASGSYRLAHAFALPLRRLARAALEEELAALMVRNEMYQSALEIYLAHERWSSVIDCYRRLQEPQRVRSVPLYSFRIHLNIQNMYSIYCTRIHIVKLVLCRPSRSFARGSQCARRRSCCALSERSRATRAAC